jgi:methionyl-tRNA formyltransferase
MHRIIFFGTGPVAEHAFNTLCEAGFTPTCLVTKPDALVGRKQLLTPPHIKSLAIARSVKVLQPVKLVDIREQLEEYKDSIFVVVSYGKILPDWLLAIPQHKTINLHPSLLPRFRGPSPLESQIRADESRMGVSVMELDAQMDHGPIIAMREITLPPIERYAEIFETLIKTGAELLIEVLRQIGRGEYHTTLQDHGKATFCTKLDKSQGEINLEGDHRTNWLTYVAFSRSIRTFFYDQWHDSRIRVIISKAHFVDGVFTPLTVIPEGKKEVSYGDYQNAKRSQVNRGHML